MLNIVVVDNLKKWNFHSPEALVVSAKSYLTDSQYAEMRSARVYNLCRSYRYQGIGYYVSLLAEARGHRVFPSVTTIQDLKSLSILRIMSDDLENDIQSSLSDIKSDHFTLNIYFGRAIEKKFEKLAQQFYNLFQVPLLEVVLVKNKKWLVQAVNYLSNTDVPVSDTKFVMESAALYFSRKRIPTFKRNNPIYEVAILVNPEEEMPPSNKKAIKKFIEAAEEIGLKARTITKDDFNHLAEYDALFIRERTEVNHYTYRFARCAEAENLVAIDDPESILKCTNKVFLTELLTKAKIPIPKTLIVHKDNMEEIISTLGLPCVLKQPDGSFSSGVIKVEDKLTLEHEIERMINHSDLIIAQQFIPTSFDWRIGLLDRKPLFACKYYMAKNHWQIILNEEHLVCGQVEAVKLEDVPSEVLKTAERAAGLIGDGLYGVDLKQIGNQVYVIEINDNPDIEHGGEDVIAKDNLYLTIMNSIFNRIEAKKNKQLVKK